MPNKIFDTSIVKKQMNILDSMLKNIPDHKELIHENKKLKNQVKQLKDYIVHLKNPSEENKNVNLPTKTEKPTPPSAKKKEVKK
ncbi:hypothetical protein fh0823_27880 (plasmid) [Francisella halioticida]|uniref:hypothetical protein n=1 Tax=Francisella halioticida TaxID=549298 RepID=UPI001AF49D45|nr:hypothetical protein [Francisella halioticida]BCD92651.1 hypothetical protein fh0823_27880 [Francisella halioticida]